MRLSKDGFTLIQRFEGLRLKAYKCSAGVWTIGYGHTKGVREGQTITEAEAENLLREDLRVFEVGVSSLVTVFLHQYQFDALVSFSFNLGVGALKGSTLLKKINARAGADAIRAEWIKWCHAGGRVVPGLQRRRLEEVTIYINGYK
jgi:lysozyme